MAYFFATPEDLLSVLLQVEGRRALAYTRCGHVNHPDVRSFCSARELPTLFETASHESYVMGPKYLVTEAGKPIAVRELSHFDGQERWSVDQLINPDSTVLTHGGRYGERILLRGEIRTASKSITASSLQRAFDTSVRRHFVKIKAFYVGKQAEELLDSGYRLTDAEQSPEAYDLCR